MAEVALAALRDGAVAREPDRYFAATLAPEALRYDLIALAAFAAELDNIPTQVREALAGEIRLQWWRDALAKSDGNAAAGHPVAMAMRAAIARHALPAEIIEAVIDSHADALHGDRPADEDALRNHMAASEGGLFRLGARISGVLESGDMWHITRAAGLAYGLSRALLHFPAEGAARLPIPRTLLADEDLVHGARDNPQLMAAIAALSDLARAALADIGPQLAKMSRLQRLPFLPLAMVRPNLQALEAWSKHRGAEPAEQTRIGRLLRITWAHARGRL
ncbi:MAG: squalene/phytoene synthase family protein [Hyphomicrobium sp.]|nr:squalene/phytoene synthase family protein [Hyphomicrobium sp.]